MEQLFFELIRVAIGTQETLSRPPTKGEWAELYAMAKKQSLVGICFVAVQKLQCNDNQEPRTKNPQSEPTPNHEPITHNLDEVQYLTWMGMAAKIQQRNEVVNAQCVEVQQMIEKEGFRTFIMKGQGNAALYQSGSNGKEGRDSKESSLPLLRQSGDIDIYLDGGFEKVNAFVQRTCPTKEINELEIHYHCFADPSTGSGEPTEVEIHYRPFILRNPIKNARLQSFFNETMRFDNKVELPNGAGCINVPTTTFNLVHHLVHTYHHFITEGVGLRQLMDYYFVILVSSQEDVRECQKMVASLGLNRFASALMWVLVNVFGLKVEQALWAPCEKDGRMLLEEILLSGNFGHTDERAKDIQTSRWKAFWFVNGKTFRFWRFDHWAWFWSPVWRAYHFCWRKSRGLK